MVSAETTAAAESLVNALRAGSEEAYETLIDRFHQPVYNLVCRTMDNPEDASDVVQEVFLKVYRNIGAFRGHSSLKTWIYRIAVNEAHNWRRWFRRRRGQEVGLDADGEGSLPGRLLTDPGRSPFQDALQGETCELIQDALEKLNPSFREAVVLRDLEDLSYEEIVEILKVPLGTVKSRIRRGREALRGRLAERLDGTSASSWMPQPAE